MTVHSQAGWCTHDFAGRVGGGHMAGGGASEKGLILIHGWYIRCIRCGRAMCICSWCTWCMCAGRAGGRHMAGGTPDPPAGNPTSRPSSKGSRGNVTSPHNTQHTGKRKTQDIKLNVRNKKHKI